MIRPCRAGFVMALLVLPSFASAAAPTLTASSPFGVQRGHATEVTLSGAGLGDSPRLVAPFAFQLEESAGSGSDASRWKFRLTIADRTAVGVYPIWVATEAGASSPILFSVGQVARATEIRLRSGAHLLGVVLNAVDLQSSDYAEYYGRAYNDYYESRVDVEE